MRSWRWLWKAWVMLVAPRGGSLPPPGKICISHSAQAWRTHDTQASRSWAGTSVFPERRWSHGTRKTDLHSPSVNLLPGWSCSWSNEFLAAVCFTLDLLWNTFQLSQTSLISILHWNCFIICGLTLFEADTSVERTVTSLAEPLWAKVGLSVPDRNQLEAGLSREGRGERRRLFEKDKSPNSQERRWSGGGWKEGRKAGWETDSLSKAAGRRRDEEKG